MRPVLFQSCLDGPVAGALSRAKEAPGFRACSLLRHPPLPTESWQRMGRILGDSTAARRRREVRQENSGQEYLRQAKWVRACRNLLYSQIIHCVVSTSVFKLISHWSDRIPSEPRQLAERANEGELTAEEQAEYEGYVRANKFVAILQAKARKLLSNSNS